MKYIGSCATVTIDGRTFDLKPFDPKVFDRETVDKAIGVLQENHVRPDFWCPVHGDSYGLIIEGGTHKPTRALCPKCFRSMGG